MHTNRTIPFFGRSLTPAEYDEVLDYAAAFNNDPHLTAEQLKELRPLTFLTTWRGLTDRWLSAEELADLLIDTRRKAGDRKEIADNINRALATAFAEVPYAVINVYEVQRRTHNNQMQYRFTRNYERWSAVLAKADGFVAEWRWQQMMNHRHPTYTLDPDVVAKRLSTAP